MKVEELRIGNLFKGDFGDDVYEVAYITPGTEMCVWIKGKNSFVKEADLEGIPLTEEWLVKFGFVRFDNFMRGTVAFRLKGFYGEGLVENNGAWFLLDYELNDVNESGIEFVHELQNFYRALTGKELEVKE